MLSDIRESFDMVLVYCWVLVAALVGVPMALDGGVIYGAAGAAVACGIMWAVWAKLT